MANELKVLANLAKDGKKLQAIGSEIVKEAITNVIEEKMGIEMSNPDFILKIEKGDIVPSELIGKHGIQVNSDGLARSGWYRSWGRINRIWERIYSGDPRPFQVAHVINEITAEMMLTPEEFKIAKEMGLLSEKL